MNVSSQLEAVTVYASGAVCTRLAKAAAPTEPTRQLRITGLPLSLRPTSLRARLVGGPESLRVLDVRAGFDVELADEVDVPAEQKAIEAAEAEVSRLEHALARVTAEAQLIAALRPTFPVQRKGEPPRAAPVESMLKLADFVDHELGQRNPRARQLEQQLADAKNDLQLHRRRLAESSTSKRTERARLSRSAVVTLSAEQKEPLQLALEYQVPGARWVPNYELRLDQGMGGGSLKMRASVAQQSGEDWSGVRLSLSTAQLDRRTDLPELRALKIGRSQPPAPRSGWREAPPGLDELFEGFEEGLANGPASGSKGGARPPQRAPAGFAVGGAAPEAAETPPEVSKSLSRPMPKNAPPPAPPPPPPARMMAPGAPSMSMAPMAQAMPVSAAAPRMRRSTMTGALGAAFGAVARGGGAPKDMARARSMEQEEMASMDDSDGAAPEEYGGDEGEATGAGFAGPMGAEPEPLPGVTPEEGLLDYDRLIMPRAHDTSHPRGRLHPAGEWEFAFVSSVSVQVEVVTTLLVRAQHQASQVEYLALPHHAISVRDSAAAYDYRFDCEARVDVGSTGKWALVPVMNAQVGLVPGYSCVPSVEPKVYRVLKISNRSPHALLQGPVDVSVGDEFLMTTVFPTVPPKGEEARLGLGVEEAIKVARKTQFKETSGGLLGGSTVLPHEVEIEINNRLPHAAAVEIRERVPVSQDTDVKIEEVQVKPAWEKDEKLRDGVQTDGARRWQLNVPAGEKTTVSAQFQIKIPSDKMLVGGNRRV